MPNFTSDPNGLDLTSKLNLSPDLKVLSKFKNLNLDGLSNNTLEIPGFKEHNTLEIPPQGQLRDNNKQSGGNIENILDLMTRQESHGDPNAKGKKGELGILQIMPSTAAMYGVSPEALSDPNINRAVARRYLEDLSVKYHGDMRKAVAAYNAGPGNVDKGNIPSSTADYVNKVLGLLGPQDAGAAEEKPVKSGLKTPDQYSSFEEYKADWKKTKQYNSLSSSARTTSFERLQNRWDDAQTEKQQNQAIQNSPDTPGSPNRDLTGRAYDKIMQGGQWLDNKIDPSGKMAESDRDLVPNLLPQNNIQGMIDLALLGTGGPEAEAVVAPILSRLPEIAQPAARLATRLGITTGAGALGGATEGKTSEGANTGLKIGLLGEAASYVAGTRFGGKAAIEAHDIKSLSNWLDSKVGSKIRSVSDLSNEFIGTGSIDRATENMAEANKFTKNSLKQTQVASNKPGVFNYRNPGQKTTVPGTIQVPISPDLAQGLKLQSGGNYSLTLDQANQLVDQVEHIGWDARFKAKNAHGAAAMRSAAHQMEKDIADAINKVNPKAGQKWYNARAQLRTARTMSNLFREYDLLNGDKLNMPELQKVVHDAGPRGYKFDIEQSMGSDKASQLDELTHRGGNTGKTDIHGQGPIEKVYGHLGIPTNIRFQMPRFSRHVGYLPYNLGKGRALVAALTHGPWELAHRLGQMFNGPENGVSAPNAQPQASPTP